MVRFNSQRVVSNSLLALVPWAAYPAETEGLELMALVEMVRSRLTVVVRAVLGFQRVEWLAALERPAPAAAVVEQAEVELATPLTVLAVSLAPLAAAAVLAAAQEVLDQAVKAVVARLPFSCSMAHLLSPVI